VPTPSKTGLSRVSYGSAGRGSGSALNALTVASRPDKVSWVLDADHQGVFDSLNTAGWKFVEMGADRRIVAGLIQKLLRARSAGRGSADTECGRDGTGGSIAQ